MDGDFGSQTEQAVASCDVTATAADYCNLREAYYRRLVSKNPRLGVFLNGWLNRLGALRREVGLPGLEGLGSGGRDLGPVPRIPDLGVDPDYDV
jgi:hypothetical protein